jgi:O-acetyl-ADP-ribose deacetylase (regulator of RNase III)
VPRDLRSTGRAAPRAAPAILHSLGPTVPLGDRLQILQADITTLDVDAIVNAANVALMPGGGVCGAIHRAAGPELNEACREVAPCPTGEARLTPGFKLKARWVVHAVGPVWMNGTQDEDRLLAACYRSALSLGERHDLSTMAFPAISTGTFSFPLPRATTIALREIGAALERSEKLQRVTCACFDAAALRTYQETRKLLDL